MTIPTYTDAASVASALRLAPDTTLAAAAAQGATSLSLQSATAAGGVPYYPGMWIALDQYNGQIREVVQITGPVSGAGPYAVPVTALLNGHGTGAPAKEVSQIEDVIAAASRLVDDATYTAAGAFAQQSWTETVEGQAVPDGRLLTRVTGRGVSAVSSLSWATNPIEPAQAVPTDAITFDDYTITVWPSGTLTASGEPVVAPMDPAQKHILVTVTYTAGWSPLPPDLARAATVLAARLFKEGDTGFSDMVGSSELGVLSYKKGIPADVAAILKPWRRWT